MNKSNNGRSVNILLSIAGVLCCIGSGFVAAPKGLLADDSVSLIQSMQTSYMLIFFAVPCALMILTCGLIILGRLDILTICTVLAGGVLFAMMDFQYGVSHRTFLGILINMIGVILMITAAALQVLATETGPAKVSRKAAKSRNPKEFRYERSHRPAYDDIYMDASGAVQSVPQITKSGISEVDEYLALDALKIEDEEEIAAIAQKEQEDEIEAMLAMLGEEAESFEMTEEAESPAQTVEESLADLKAEFDVQSKNLLEEIEAETNQIASEIDLSIPEVSASTSMIHMAEALETPNQTMTDFYDGIEEIFLDQKDN